MIPTEPIGSIPRPKELIDGIAAIGDGTDPRLEPLYDAAIQDTMRQFEATGSPVITDGEQRKYHNSGPTASRAWKTRRPMASAFRSSPGTCGACPDSERALSLQTVRRQIPRTGAAPFHGARQAGGHLAVGAESHVSRRWHRRLLARGVHRRPGERARHRGAPLPRHGRALRADRFHRGASRDQDGSHRRPARELHRSQQPGARAA